MNFSKTINLPKTNFSMKANLSATENNWIEFWKKKKSTGKLKIKVQNPCNIFCTTAPLCQW